MAQRIFLHVGTPKTGTTYLQSVLWANKASLLEQGILLPQKDLRSHYFLSCIARNAKEDLAAMPKSALGIWDRMLAQVSAWEGDVLISHELFSMILPDRAHWSLRQLENVCDELQILVTARDLARQIPAEWQQSIKHGRSHRLGEYYELVRSRDTTIRFWRPQGLVELLQTWSQGVPSDRVQLITVPPRGAPEGLLWRRYAGALGIAPDSVEQSLVRPNESLGFAEIETLRRVNAAAGEDLRTPTGQLLTRVVMADGILAARPGTMKFAPPADQHGWVVQQARSMVDALRPVGYHVVGDLDELIPPAQPVSGPNPDDASDSDVATVAVESIPEVLFRTHDAEVRSYLEEMGRLNEHLEIRHKHIRWLQDHLAEAREAYQREYRLPVWRHLVRRGRTLARRGRWAPK